MYCLYHVMCCVLSNCVVCSVHVHNVLLWRLRFHWVNFSFLQFSSDVKLFKSDEMSKSAMLYLYWRNWAFWMSLCQKNYFSFNPWSCFWHITQAIKVINGSCFILPIKWLPIRKRSHCVQHVPVFVGFIGFGIWNIILLRRKTRLQLRWNIQILSVKYSLRIIYLFSVLLVYE